MLGDGAMRGRGRHGKRCGPRSEVVSVMLGSKEPRDGWQYEAG